ncbi:U-box domain-containing protein 33 [Morella rubra]|uniref:RING-type E3 ubiquitin transferase n=1 Tax=Morella rubra TaxID=262757 RepID=A0A6A1VNB0_9ROSI|nr:U-box domain-containing protein 33 [Morella rubra]
MDVVSPPPPITCVMKNTLYVAVGSEGVKQNKPLLLWALKYSGGRKICIMHVHRPANTVPIMGTKFPASRTNERELRAYQAIQRQKMLEILDEYRQICCRRGVQAETLFAEVNSVEEGIVALILQHGISELVMGAAADKRYSKKMGLKSKKATYVRQNAPLSCHIQFICRGSLIETRFLLVLAFGERIVDRADHRTDVCSPGWTTQSSTSRGNFDAEGSSSDWNSERYAAASRYSTCSSSGVRDLGRIPSLRSEGRHVRSEINEAISQYSENLHHPSAPHLADGISDYSHFAQSEESRPDAENARLEGFPAGERLAKAEKVAIEAMRRAQAWESLHGEEVKQRKDTEEALAREKEEHKNVNKRLNVALEDIRIASDKISSLESQIAESDSMIKGWELRMASVLDLLQTYRKEREEVEEKCDKALKEAEELRRKKEKATSAETPQFFYEVSFLEIEEATRHFDPSLRIGEGRHGTIYKALLRQTVVAIKKLHQNKVQDPLGYQLEVDTLSTLKHPNLVKLIGSCEEAQAFVYEYVPNGTLEDRLRCKDNTPPLSWQTRICIATELCSALVFLHSSKPVGILHGDLSSAKVLLDANFVSKLCGFGNCYRITPDRILNDNITPSWRTEPEGTTLPYLDPEFLHTGELTLNSDTYSFGIILLQLLTGEPPALGIKRKVKCGLDAGEFQSLLDPLAGDWPFEQAKELAQLALRCCEMCRETRPDFKSEVWTVLEPMRDLYGRSGSSQLGSEGHSEPPSYLLCPISQEVMKDPHVAADGFSYEAQNLRDWFERGHDTSPMTNLKLEHRNLVRNHALRSAMQEWRLKSVYTV